ncbi:MAG: tripartite-type tricarboxylate transporter receptor subunit TctC [Gammaproteobacteria bacterium]|jgi:tripartite-type tricarboxylate transporter receptor subunit TctC
MGGSLMQSTSKLIFKIERTLLFCLLLVLASCSSETGPDNPQQGPDPQTFYKDEVLHIIVGFNPGGGFDEYARMIGNEISTRTGGTVVIENQPGGGGLLALNRLVQSQPTGLNIMLLGGESAVLAQITKREGIRFDITDLNLLGRAQIDTPMVLWSKTNPETTFAEVLKTINEKGSSWGANGLTDNISDAESALAEGLGLSKEQFGIVTGYSGSSEVALAVVRGEVDGIVVSNSSAINYVGSGDEGMVAVATLSRSREQTFFPDVPTVFEVADMTEAGQAWVDFRSSITEVGRTFVTHREVDPEKVTYLRNVLQEILTDEEFISMANERKRPINYMSAEDQEQLVQGIFADLSAERIEEVKHVLTEKFIR